MPVSTKYDSGRGDQITRIKKIANACIVIVWLAGFGAIMILLGYFLFFSENAKDAISKKNDSRNGIARITDETVFADKTALVNIGLRMQAIREDSTVESNGTIGINKIIHDQKLSKIKKEQAPVIVPEKKIDFAIKAVPQ